MHCPPGTVFDVASCTCNREAVVTCPSDCDDENPNDGDANFCNESEYMYNQGFGEIPGITRNHKYFDL